MIVSEWPDEEATMRLLLATGMQGDIRPTTLRAFSEEEMERIVEKLPWSSLTDRDLQGSVGRKGLPMP